MAAIDRLITRLELEDKFSKAAGDAEDQADELAEALEKLKESNYDLKQVFKGSAIDVAAMSPLFQNAGFAATRFATVLGTQVGGALVRAGGALAQVGTMIFTTPHGIIAAVVALSAAFVAMAATVGGSVGLVIGSVQTLLPSISVLGQSFATLVGVKLAMPFIKANAEIDSMRRNFTGLLGDAKLGGQAMSFAQDYGLRSPLEQPQIQESMRTLYSLGQDVNRYLPAMERIALFRGEGGGATLGSNMAVLMNAIRYAVGGRSGEAVENLGQIGIGRNMLIQHGARFDNQGRILNTVEEFMDILEKISESPAVMRVADQMKDSDAVKLSNLSDALRLAMQEVGAALSKYVMPAIKQATELFSNIAKSGWIGKVIDGYAELFGMGGDNSLAKAVAGAMTFVEVLPSVISNVITIAHAGFKAIAAVMEPIIKAAMGFVGGPTGFLAAEVLFASARAASQIPQTVMDLAKYSVGWDDRYKKNLGRVTGGDGGFWDGLTAPAVPDDLQLPPNPQLAEVNEHLRLIREDTKKMVEVNRVSLGGGELGRLGVSAVDVSDWKRGRERAPSADPLAAKIAAAIREAMGDAIMGERRGRGRAYG